MGTGDIVGDVVLAGIMLVVVIIVVVGLGCLGRMIFDIVTNFKYTD